MNKYTVPVNEPCFLGKEKRYLLKGTMLEFLQMTMKRKEE